MTTENFDVTYARRTSAREPWTKTAARTWVTTKHGLVIVVARTGAALLSLRPPSATAAAAAAAAPAPKRIVYVVHSDKRQIAMKLGDADAAFKFEDGAATDRFAKELREKLPDLFVLEAQHKRARQIEAAAAAEAPNSVSTSASDGSSSSSSSSSSSGGNGANSSGGISSSHFHRQHQQLLQQHQQLQQQPQQRQLPEAELLRGLPDALPDPRSPAAKRYIAMLLCDPDFALFCDEVQSTLAELHGATRCAPPPPQQVQQEQQQQQQQQQQRTHTGSDTDDGQPMSEDCTMPQQRSNPA